MTRPYIAWCALWATIGIAGTVVILATPVVAG